jgi:hypothetical protein
MNIVPSLEGEHDSELTETAVRAEQAGGCSQERTCQLVRPDHRARIPKVKCIHRVSDPCRRDRPELLDDIGTVGHRIDGAEEAQAKRVVGWHVESRDEFDGGTSDVGAELAPENADKHRLECVDGAEIVAGRSPLLRDGDESSYCGVSGREAALERFQVMGCLRLLEGRQPKLVSLSEQSNAIGRLPQLPFEYSGSVEPQGAAPAIGRQPSASFQRCRGDCVRTAKLCTLCGRFEPYSYLFDRTCSGTGGVPGSTIRIIGESLGESGMRSPPRLSRRRLLDR